MNGRYKKVPIGYCDGDENKTPLNKPAICAVAVFQLCAVFVRCGSTEFNDMVNRLTHTVNMNVDAMKADRATWAEQFRNALNVNGGDVENATNFDYAMHFLTFFWKVCIRLGTDQSWKRLLIVASSPTRTLSLTLSPETGILLTNAEDSIVVLVCNPELTVEP